MSKAMIVTVGGTADPIIKTVSENKPGFVAFIASQGTFVTVAKVCDAISFKFDKKILLVDNPDSLLDCYAKSEEAARLLQEQGIDRTDVLVDYTGGTKNMSAAVVLATVAHGFRFSYVGGEKRTKDGVGIVEAGHEKIFIEENPWDILAVEERQKLAVLFNSYQFKGAVELGKIVASKISPRKQPLFRRLVLIFEAYEAWDRFQHLEALKKLQQADIKTFKEIALAAGDDLMEKFISDVETSKAFLDRLVQNSQGGKKICLEYAQDMIANAQRRFVEGKVDDAILRLYRTVELLAQARLLNKHSVNTSDVKASQLPEDLRTVFEKKYYDPKDQKIKLPLGASFELLDVYGDELGARYKAQQEGFLNLQSARNYLYLEHGLNSLSSASWQGHKDFVQQLLGEGGMVAFPRLAL